MPVRADVLLALAHHLAPRGRRWVDSDADERERGLREDRFRDTERHRDDDGRERVGHDVAPEHAAEPGAKCPRPVDELFFLDGQDLSAGLARDPDPAGEADGDEDVREAGAQHRHDQDHEQQARERVHHVDEASEDQVGPPAHVARQRADRHAHDHDDHLRAEPDQHRHSGAVDHPGEQVATELIGAQGIRAGGRLVEAAEVRLGVRKRREEIGEDRDQTEQHNDDAAGHRETIA